MKNTDKLKKIVQKSSLTNEELLYITYAEDLNMDLDYLDTIFINKSTKEKYKFRGFIWKYELTEIKSTNFENELLIQLDHILEIKSTTPMYATVTTSQGAVVYSAPMTSVYAQSSNQNPLIISGGNVSYSPNNCGISYSNNGGWSNIQAITGSYVSTLPTKDEVQEIIANLNHKLNFKLEHSSDEQKFIPIADFYKKYMFEDGSNFENIQFIQPKFKITIEK